MTSAQKWGIGLIVAASVLVLGAAIIATVSSWNLDNALVVAIFVAVLQVASALVFMQDAKKQVEQERTGRPADELVESTTRRLGGLSDRASQLSAAATAAREQPNLKVSDARYVLGVVSVQLDTLAEGVADAQQDWKFHPAAIMSVPPLPIVDPDAPEDGSEPDGEPNGIN